MFSAMIKYWRYLGKAETYRLSASILKLLAALHICFFIKIKTNFWVWSHKMMRLGWWWWWSNRKPLSSLIWSITNVNYACLKNRTALFGFSVEVFSLWPNNEVNKCDIFENWRFSKGMKENNRMPAPFGGSHDFVNPFWCILPWNADVYFKCTK